MNAAAAPSLAQIGRLEDACETAVTRLIGAAGRCIDQPSPGAWPRYDAFREQLVNQCDRLAFLLLRTHAHREYRARYFADFARFSEEWPDLFTEPEVFPSLRRLVALWSAPGDAEPTPPMSLNRRGELASLLCRLFDDASLRRWISHHAAFEALHAQLPGPTAPLIEVSSKFCELAERHGLLDAEFFAALKATYPRRCEDIAAVEQMPPT